MGATNVSLQVVSAMWLYGVAGDMQISNGSLACVFSIGGAAVANYVSILERAKYAPNSRITKLQGHSPMKLEYMNHQAFNKDMVEAVTSLSRRGSSQNISR